jgi:hypothetical protein
MSVPERSLILRLLLQTIRFMTVAAELNPDHHVEEQEKGGEGQKP